MQIGFSFMISSGIRVLLSRNDHEFDQANPLSCLYDRSCVEARLASSNSLKLDAVLTSGLYKIVVLEKESRSVSRALNQECSLETKLITFSLEAFPII